MNPNQYIFKDSITKKLAEQLDTQRTVIVLDKLLQWMDSNISYNSDMATYGFDYIQPPSVTVRYGKGDCQDITALITSVLNELNIPFRLVIGILKQNKMYNHIWIEVKDNHEIYIVDGTIPNYFVKDTKSDRMALTTSEWI